MENVQNWVRIAGAAISGALAWAFGPFDGFLQMLVFFTVLDYATGVFAAYVKKELSSQIGAKGIVKKVMIFAVVAVAHILDNAAGLGGVVRMAVLGFYVANEGISITENAARCGVPVPKPLLKALKQLQGEDEPDAEQE